VETTRARTPIPLFAASLDQYQDRIAERLTAVAASGKYILGPEVAAFEREFADYVGAKHCIGVANGTDALTLALRAIGVQPGDEVVMPSLTFYATAEAAVNAGARPVFCDVDLDTLCITRETVEAVVTERTKAIVPVHLFGKMANVEELRALGLPIVEDAAQAAGAGRAGKRPAGSLGDAATFSFFPSKNLGCLGDGGAVTTNDDEVAEHVRRLRFHGSKDKVTFTEIGYNSRLDELQAAVLRVLLPELDGWTESRQRIARAYAERGLDELMSTPTLPDGGDHVYHLYVARHDRADELQAALGERGVSARGYYRVPVHLQPSMLEYGGDQLDLPATAEAARTNIALPMGPQLGEEAVDDVVAACAEALG
jgi:dTDP-3-amino-3,4,6-trideoxy-alpha-D-glucose transaminase